MSPASASFDFAYRGLLNSIFGSYFYLRSCICAYCNGLSFRQLSLGAPFATITGSVLYPIGLVGLCGIPPQIFESVIERVSVVMASLKAWGPKANEGLKNRAMWPHRLMNAIFVQRQKWAVIAVVSGFFSDFFFFTFTADGPNTPLRRHLIKAFVPNNISPVFHWVHHRLFPGAV